MRFGCRGVATGWIVLNLLAAGRVFADIGWSWGVYRLYPTGLTGVQQAGATNSLASVRNWDVQPYGVGLSDKASIGYKAMSARLWANAPQANVDLISIASASGSVTGPLMHLVGNNQYF